MDAAEPSHDGATVQHGVNILVVEDDPILAPLVCEMLRHRHHTVTLVGTAAEALELLARADQHFDLLFSDVLLPAGMDGMELAREVRRRYPDLPVGLTTGYSALSRAAPDVQDIPLLRKPCRLEDLDDLVMGLVRASPRLPGKAQLN